MKSSYNKFQRAMKTVASEICYIKYTQITHAYRLLFGGEWIFPSFVTGLLIVTMRFHSNGAQHACHHNTNTEIKL